MQYRFLIAVISQALAAPAMADASQYEEMLKAQNYRGLAEVIDRRAATDEELTSWLRSHSNDWHPPIFYTLSNRLLSKAMSDIEKKLVSKETFTTVGEMAQFYARGKTAFQVEIADCVSKTSPSLNYWLRRNSDLTLSVEVMMARNRNSTVAVAEQSVQWAKGVFASTPRPPARWLCGEGNVLPEETLVQARAAALAAVEKQVARLKVPPNTSFQGTLRDEAAQRP